MEGSVRRWNVLHRDGRQRTAPRRFRRDCDASTEVSSQVERRWARWARAGRRRRSVLDLATRRPSGGRAHDNAAAGRRPGGQSPAFRGARASSRPGCISPAVDGNEPRLPVAVRGGLDDCPTRHQPLPELPADRRCPDVAPARHNHGRESRPGSEKLRIRDGLTSHLAPHALYFGLPMMRSSGSTSSRTKSRRSRPGRLQRTLRTCAVSARAAARRFDDFFADDPRPTADDIVATVTQRRRKRPRGGGEGAFRRAEALQRGSGRRRQVQGRNSRTILNLQSTDHDLSEAAHRLLERAYLCARRWHERIADKVFWSRRATSRCPRRSARSRWRRGSRPELRGRSAGPPQR